MRKRSYFHLSSFYFFFYAVIGTFVPYWASYLKYLGFNAVEIGQLIAVVMASKIVAPYFLSWLSDHLGKRLIIIQLTMLISVLIFAAILPYQSYWWFVSVLGLFGFFWNASLPLFEALTLSHLADESQGYGKVRLWGSIGFIVAVILLPAFIEGDNIRRLPYIILALLFANALTTLFLSDKSAQFAEWQPAKLTDTFRNKIVLALLFTCALQTMSHGAYYTFYTIYLEDHNYSREIAGWLWALGVLAEIILFLLIRPLFKRFNICSLFVLSLFITVMRWVILALWVDNPYLVIFAQLLHAASFGLFHITAIQLVHDLFPGRLQARGQAIYAGVSFGVGGAFGHLISGYTWTSLGATWTYLGAACLSFISAMIAAKYIRQEHLPRYANGMVGAK